MKRNKYDEGKQIIQDYMNQMQDLYNYNMDLIKEYEELVDGEIATFDYETGKKFVKAWESILALKPYERNLIILYLYHGKDLEKVLEYFNDIRVGKPYKNQKSLAVIIFNIKQKLKHDI